MKRMNLSHDVVAFGFRDLRQHDGHRDIPDTLASLRGRGMGNEVIREKHLNIRGSRGPVSRSTGLASVSGKINENRVTFLNFIALL